MIGGDGEGPTLDGSDGPMAARMSDSGGSRLSSLALLMGIALLIGVAAPFVQFEVERLLFSMDASAAVALRFRLEETAAWWGGRPVYAEHAHAVYPPHAYLLLRALVVDTSMGVARWAWATQLAALVGMACLLFARWGQQEDPMRRLFTAMVPLLVGATWQGVGSGQLHYLPMAAGAGAVWLVAGRDRMSLGRDAEAAALMVLALMKPSSSLPLLILFGVLAGRGRPLALVAGILGLSTLMAAGLQPDSVFALISDYLGRASTESTHGALPLGVTLGLLALFGVWATLRRSSDRLALVAVACVVARLAVVHPPHDDVLMLPALLVLLQAAPKHRAARVLLVLSVLLMALPGPPVLSEALMDTVRRALSWVYIADGAVVVWLVERRSATPAP